MRQNRMADSLTDRTAHMKLLDITDIAPTPGIRTDRPDVSVLYDTPHARVVLYRFRPGQGLPLHKTASSVLLTVVEGAGVFTGMGQECTLGPGRSVVYAPHEAHAMRAEDQPFTVLATMTPSPAANR
jgi:quercetin dioxygenase-like cupin family protein